MNERGLTLIELLIAMSILVTTLIVSVSFYKSYAVQTSELGEYLTAKNLSIKALEHVRGDFLENGKRSGTEIYSGIIKIREVDYEITVEQVDLTPYVAVYSQEVDMVKLTANTSWRNRETEVSLYVSAP